MDVEEMEKISTLSRFKKIVTIWSNERVRKNTYTEFYTDNINKRYNWEFSFSIKFFICRNDEMYEFLVEFL